MNYLPSLLISSQFFLIQTSFTHGDIITLSLSNRRSGDSYDGHLPDFPLPGRRQAVRGLHQGQDGAALPSLRTASALHGAVPVGRRFKVEVR